MPSEWESMLCFGNPLPASLFHEGDDNEMVYMCARVCLMGRLSAVAVFLNYHCGLIRQSCEDVMHVMPFDGEWARCNGVPDVQKLGRF